MKFKPTTPPMVLVEFVKDNTFSKVELGIPKGHRYVMSPRMAYGFQFQSWEQEIGPHYLPYTSYMKFKECFKIIDWLDEHDKPITHKQAIERMIMVHRETLSKLYQELKDASSHTG